MDQRRTDDEDDTGGIRDEDDDATVAAANGGAVGADSSVGTPATAADEADAAAAAAVAAATMAILRELHTLCELAASSLSADWDVVRRWLSVHTVDEVRRSAECLGEYNTTPLHLACKNHPPADVVDVLLSAAPDTVKWEDSFGWLPLHYACANGAVTDVLRELADAFPESKTATDRRGKFFVLSLSRFMFFFLFLFFLVSFFFPPRDFDDIYISLCALGAFFIYI